MECTFAIKQFVYHGHSKMYHKCNKVLLFKVFLVADPNVKFKHGYVPKEQGPWNVRKLICQSSDTHIYVITQRILHNSKAPLPYSKLKYFYIFGLLSDIKIHFL